MPESISVDMGVTDAFISDYGKKIAFTGKGSKTDVGKRLSSPTVGMSVNDSGGTEITEEELSDADNLIGKGLSRIKVSKVKPKRKGKRENWLDELTSLKGFRP